MTPSPPLHQPSDARHSGRLGQHSPRLLQVNKSARSETTNPVRQRPLRSFSPSPPTPILQGKAIAAGALFPPPPTNPPGQNPPKPPAPTPPPPPPLPAPPLF